ncbi:MAG TPA: hypothetical protein PLB62_16610, partial [Candidatus Sumerlaeota bacterium]|nr:hypothetical protein [Candidatus Sumerlaeota bacterium]
IHIPPTDFIDQGPGTGLTARNIHYSATGNETIDLPTGRYKIVFSRGPEYDNYEEEILITYTGNNEINARLNRVVDTAGYITADIGVRTNNSQDCYVTPEDRLVTAAAEGVEYIVSGDSNIAFNLAPALEKTGLAPFIRTGIGKRFEFAGPDSPGTFLIWPFSEAEAAREGVSLDTKNAPGFFKSIRAQYPDSLIQVCRPGFPLEGYFTRFGYDHKEKHTITDPEFSYEFDLLEFWEGKRFGASEETLKMMMNVWLAGYDRIRPTGGSFSHETWGEEVGYPRLYIATENDDPAKVTDKDIVAGIRKGNYQISNGPFIKFTVNGMPPGSIVTDTDGTIDCHLEVFAPPWVHTSYIEVKMDGIFLKRTIQPPSTAVKRFPGETSIEGADNFRLKIKKDSIITVEVVG